MSEVSAKEATAKTTIMDTSASFMFIDHNEVESSKHDTRVQMVRKN